MTKLVIFGTTDFARLAKFYIQRHTDDSVCFFTCEKKFRPRGLVDGIPTVTFETIETRCPPEEYQIFAPMSGTCMNTLRERIYYECKKKGYKMYNYISPLATVLTTDIGENNFILEHNVIQPFVKIGNNNVFWSGNHIGHHSTVGNHCFFSSHVVLSGHCTVKDNCWFGVNSTIADGLTLGSKTLVAMSSGVTKSTEPESIYMGLPAKKMDKDVLEVSKKL